MSTFKYFLLNESKAYLGQKVGDILTAVQELRDDSANMGTRDLTRFSERIVNQIRRILHSNWPREEKKHLVTLQKVGVALMKAIEEKSDLPGAIAGSASTLEKLVANLGIPIHKLATTDEAPQEDAKGVSSTPQDQSVPPPQPQTLNAAPPTTPPTPSLTGPPLGGTPNSPNLDAF